MKSTITKDNKSFFQTSIDGFVLVDLLESLSVNYGLRENAIVGTYSYVDASSQTRIENEIRYLPTQNTLEMIDSETKKVILSVQFSGKELRIVNIILKNALNAYKTIQDEHWDVEHYKIFYYNIKNKIVGDLTDNDWDNLANFYDSHPEYTENLLPIVNRENNLSIWGYPIYKKALDAYKVGETDEPPATEGYGYGYTEALFTWQENAIEEGTLQNVMKINELPQHFCLDSTYWSDDEYEFHYFTKKDFEDYLKAIKQYITDWSLKKQHARKNNLKL